MILRALYDYYRQHQDELPPEGKELKEIPFVLVLDAEGRLLRIEDHRKAGKRVQRFLVVKGMRQSNILPRMFWDNAEYLFNYPSAFEVLSVETSDEGNKNPQSNKKTKGEDNARHKAAVDLYHKIAEQHPDNVGFRAICRFYDDGYWRDVVKDPLWEDIKKNPMANMSFRLDGEPWIVAGDDSLRAQFKTAGEGVCLVTGKRGVIVALTTPTPIGGNGMASLVSFQADSGYDSYGKSQCSNAPISIEAEEAYTTALNHLLDRDSRNKFNIGDRTFVFWASSCSEAAKASVESYGTFWNADVDDYDQKKKGGVENVHKVFEAIYKGQLKTDLDDRFYILGLAPNKGREAVVYWEGTDLKTFASRLLRHFEDMAIVDTRPNAKPCSGLWQMMSAVALEGKVSKVQPNLPEAVMRSIHSGAPYPYALLMACLRRIRAEQQDTTIQAGNAMTKTQRQQIGAYRQRVVTRAAILKAYINRIPSNSKPITVMLDKDNTNIGYVCGRLFAVLERIQEKSNNNNSNIRSRYMNGASATPAAVFPTLLNLSVHHSDKLDGGWQTHFERLKGEIIDAMPADGFPTHLNLVDQGRFMVGYYQQRQDFFRKKDETQE